MLVFPFLPTQNTIFCFDIFIAFPSAAARFCVAWILATPTHPLAEWSHCDESTRKLSNAKNGSTILFGWCILCVIKTLFSLVSCSSSCPPRIELMINICQESVDCLLDFFLLPLSIWFSFAWIFQNLSSKRLSHDCEDDQVREKVWHLSFSHWFDG